MIISASRRTDIPAFYSKWFINRIRAGYCTVPNPFNRKQIAQVSLLPKDVDVIVFWTRNPKPLFPFLVELDQRGYRYYFQFTLLGYPPQIEPNCVSRSTAISTFQELADRVGSERVIWRYDPVVFSHFTDAQYHAENYTKIAAALRNYSHLSVISIMDMYTKNRKRIDQLKKDGLGIINYDGSPSQLVDDLMTTIVQVARENEMRVQSCAEDLMSAGYGIEAGKCIDDQYISTVFGLEVDHRKDPNQRKNCGCVVSKDIGMYDSCLFDCPYCYATGSAKRARENNARHDPDSPSLVGWYD